MTNPELPRGLLAPPPNVSLAQYVETEWNSILQLWRRGWVSDTRVEFLQSLIESERVAIFVEKTKGNDFNWEQDFYKAADLNRHNIDIVTNRKKHLADVRELWTNYCERSQDAMLQLAMEALRSMVLLNGAAILAALTILSGQVIKPSVGGEIAARVGICFCVLSLIMMAAGHSISFLAMNKAIGKVRAALLGNSRHSKVYALGRYLRIRLDTWLRLANGLIFGSIFVFAFGSGVSAIILAVN